MRARVSLSLSVSLSLCVLVMCVCIRARLHLDTLLLLSLTVFNTANVRARLRLHGRQSQWFAEQRLFVPLEDSGEERDAAPSAGEDKKAYVRRKTKEFNERLRREPEDANLWTAYIDFQVRWLSCTSPQPKKNEICMLVHVFFSPGVFSIEKSTL